MELDTTLHEDSDKSLLRVGLGGGLNSDTAPELEDILDQATAASW